MFAPRTLIIAGVALIAVALGPSGHGLWWLVGFLWFVPHAGRHGHACGPRARARHRRDRIPAASTGPSSDRSLHDPLQPDPTRDRHEAFPGG